MTQDQENKLKLLVQKYNDILLVSMKLAVAEDLINLIILNGDDKEFHLSNLQSFVAIMNKTVLNCLELMKSSQEG